MVILESPNHLVSLNPGHWIFKSVFNPQVRFSFGYWRESSLEANEAVESPEAAQQGRVASFRQTTLSLSSTDQVWNLFMNPFKDSESICQVLPGRGCNSPLTPSGHPSTARTAIEDL
eukprot:Gb_28348 [translate_table: standard]